MQCRRADIPAAEILPVMTRVGMFKLLMYSLNDLWLSAL